MKELSSKTKQLLVQSLKDSEVRYRRLFEAAQDGILILDSKTGTITDVNPYMIKMLGYSREEFIQKKLWEVGAFKDVEASKDAFKILQKNEYIRYKDLPLKAIDGRLIQVEFVSNVYWAGGERVIQCNIRDITERVRIQDALQKSEADLREQSVRDYLTGLFNRRYMEETLERDLMRATRNHLSLGVIMLDVDDFKTINDSHGHAAGDQILRELGKIILNQVRGEDIPCRYGGDEFIIILPDAPRTVIYDRARLLCEKARQFDYQFEGYSLNEVTISIGLATFPEHGATSSAILRIADSALYRAKHAGRGQMVIAD
ncbi:MAG: GGDEF domain-containing protein [Anaerolineales bacterium]|nr:GGDEF domain-containing protein [Anaerolineales bacterium]MBP6208496.1 GGDEF domain-containing protein [Anaerolineales bacterium]MBP8165010.1 GGDEF domain-containing protein [Anaerolineales bacterium]